LVDLIEAHNPKILVIDSLNPMRRTLSEDDYLAFTRYVQLMCKEKRITAILTYRSPRDPRALSDSEVTTVVDNMIVLTFDEENKQELRSQILVAKMRGSGHDKHRRYYAVDSGGISIAEVGKSGLR
jgi:circadian clock protein KaiC